MDIITNYVINENGKRRIREFLAEHHKPQEFDDGMILAWAAPAEDDMNDDRTPTIEIDSHHAIMGRAITLELDNDDFDAREVEID